MSIPRWTNSQELSQESRPPTVSGFLRACRFELKIAGPEMWEVIHTYLRTRSSTINYLLARKDRRGTGPEAPEFVWCFIRFDREVRLYRDHLPMTEVQSLRIPDYQLVEKIMGHPLEDGDLLVEQGNRPVPPLRLTTSPYKVTIQEAREMDPDNVGNLPVTLYRQVKQLRADWEVEKAKERGPYFQPVQVFWICGPTGTGKTQRVVAAGATTVTYNNGFFSDWGNSKIIAFEEFRGEVPYRLILQLTDSYHGYYTVNIKGSHKVVDIDCIYFTSPFLPEMVYFQQARDHDLIDQFLRRITEIIKLGPAQYFDDLQRYFSVHGMPPAM